VGALDAPNGGRSSWSLGAGGVSVGGAGVVRYDDDIEEDEDWG